MSAPLTGQITVSGTAQALSATAQQVTAFVIKAPQTNAAKVFVGPSGVTTANGYQLDPGDTLDYEVKFQNGRPAYQLKPSDFFVVGTAPDVVCWLASP